MDDDRKPISRPAKFRGKVIRPCKDGEHAPAWLTEMGIPARLERQSGPAVFTPGWPTMEAIAA